jgi:2-(1,2-epoxy-1,2-dihydrophenyl)acetyl-CoA isomerase
MAFEHIRYEVTGPIARLTMYRPERRNAMTNRMVHETRVALGAAAEDRSIRVLVLTGAGSSFCPGADINGIADGASDVALAAADFEVPALLHEMSAVTIAAINGACAGAGMMWALACDLRIASKTAKLNTAFLDVGVAGDMGGPWTLARLVGPSKARELFFLPTKLTGEDAERLGIVSSAVDDDDLGAAVDAITARLTAAAPIALRTLKQNFVASERMGLRDYVALETERHMALFRTHDTVEAFRARAEGRPPQFQDR